MTEKTVFFDGRCNLCSWSVRFIAKRDDGKFGFSPLSSNKANSLGTNADSVVLLKNNQEYLKSEAVAEILAEMKFPWSIAGKIIAILPVSLMNLIYDVIASSRYRIFGRKDRCMIPDKDLEKRFLD